MESVGSEEAFTKIVKFKNISVFRMSAFPEMHKNMDECLLSKDMQQGRPFCFFLQTVA